MRLNRIKTSKYSISKYITFLLVGIYCLNSYSCANTKAAPSGGPKDTIPPVIVKLLPDSNAVNVARSKSTITITFNEYVQLKDASKNIILSPPQDKRPKTKIKGKSIVVSFEKDLDSAKTYTINFGNAIADNNEGNPLPFYVYTFSTGNTIDSMLVTGSVYDYSSLLPVEGVSVALYSNAKDSSVFNTLPDAISRTDKWGFFTIRNVKPIPYSIFAFKDENGNNKYEAGNEKIGFLDTLFTPTQVMKNGMNELKIFDMKDTLGCLYRKSELELTVFNELATKQYIRDYKRTGERSAYIKFGAPNVQIDSFSIKGIRHSRLIEQFNRTHDSLSFWIKDGAKLEDTLFLGIKYLKTDSLNKLVPTVENLKLIIPKEKPSKDNKNKVKKKERKDLLKFNVLALPEKVEQDGIIFEFTDPLLIAKFDTLRFTTTTPKKQVFKEKFNTKPDSIDIRKYILKPEEPFKKGNDYELIIPKATFTDINGFTNDSTYLKFSLPTDDKLSSLILDCQNVDTRYIVELVNETRDKIFRTFVITKDDKLMFPYITKGVYSIRITEDKNANGMLDVGSVLEKRQAEKVVLYKLANNKNVIEIGERVDLEQTIDLKKLFNK